MEDQRRKDQMVRLLKIIAVCLTLLVVLVVLLNLDSLFGLMTRMFRILSSILYGFLFAFLLNPLVNLLERWVRPILIKLLRDRAGRAVSRVLGLLFAIGVVVLFFFLMIDIIAPRAADSINDIVDRFPAYYASIEEWVLNLLKDPRIREVADMVLARAYDFLDDFVNQDLLGSAQAVLVTVTSSLYAVVAELISMLIGIVVAIYVVLSKDTFLAQSKKMIVAVFQEETADRIMEHGRKINKIFNGFIVGKLLDSLIVGILCYIGLQILKIPYPELLAVIVGITNIIPYFGPFLGAIPSALLLLLVDPIKCLYFVVFVIVLQQLDGNVIGPKILGGNVGISSFWILVSISVGSGLFGFAGMLLGVPVFATIYMLVSDFTNRALRRKGMETNTCEYFKISKVQDLPHAETAEEEEG